MPHQSSGPRFQVQTPRFFYLNFYRMRRKFLQQLELSPEAE